MPATGEPFPRDHQRRHPQRISQRSTSMHMRRSRMDEQRRIVVLAMRAPVPARAQACGAGARLSNNFRTLAAIRAAAY